MHNRNYKITINYALCIMNYALIYALCIMNYALI